MIGGVSGFCHNGAFRPDGAVADCDRRTGPARHVTGSTG